MARDKTPDDRQFHANDRVKAAHDLPGVPAGTKGRVVLVNGLTWRRYRVDFANGVWLGLLDAQHLERA